MNIVEVVILVGAQCMSPMQSAPGLTEVGKVQCAVLISQDPQTHDIEILPPSAATDPNVIAMLVKPQDTLTVAKTDRPPVETAGDVTGSVTPAPHIVPTSAEVDPADVIAAPKPVIRKHHAARPVEKKRIAARRDACGSYKAVWYTNKDGHRKYRCVKSG